ncbi:hypothetical protein ACFW04_002912 [Cataglyphis niger]
MSGDSRLTKTATLVKTIGIYCVEFSLRKSNDSRGSATKLCSVIAIFATGYIRSKGVRFLDRYQRYTYNSLYARA